jgi:hypothetical protein
MKITTTKDDNGKEIALVPLFNSRKKAAIYIEDYNELLAMGVPTRWRLVYGVLKVRLPGQRADSFLARLLLDCGPGQIVRFKDRNKTNLRRDNLVIAPGQGKYRARDVLH